MSTRRMLALPIATERERRHDPAVDPLVSHRDVTTIMAALGDIRADVAAIRAMLEEDDGTEEESDPEVDA